jgi:hypothetical protein
MDMVIITETEEFFASELRVIVGDDGIWDPKAVTDVGKEEHHLLRFDLHDWLSLDPF